jgi:hypothetical protein
MKLRHRSFAAIKPGLRRFGQLTSKCWDWLFDGTREAARSIGPRRFRPTLEGLEERVVPNAATILADIPSAQNAEGQYVQIAVSATDPDNDPLSYSRHPLL